MITSSSLILQSSVISQVQNVIASSRLETISQIASSLITAINLQTTLSVLSAFGLPNVTSINYLSAFQVIFGLSARQTSTSLIINKNDLTGLTPALINTAESLLVGILVNCLVLKPYFNDKLNVLFWGTGIENGFKISTLEIFLLNLVQYIDTYEIAINNNVNVMNY